MKILQVGIQETGGLESHSQRFMNQQKRVREVEEEEKKEIFYVTGLWQIFKVCGIGDQPKF